MKLNSADFRRKCQHPLLLAAASVPLMVLYAAYVLPEALPVMLPCFPAAYVLLAWACLPVPGRWRLVAAFLGTAALGGLAAAVLPIRQAWALVLIPAAYAALLFAVLPVAGWPANRELSAVWSVGGMVAHVLAQLVCDHAGRSGSRLYEPAKPLLLVSFLVFIVLAVLAANRISLENASQSRVGVPVRMRRQNTLLTLGMLLLAVLLAALPAIGAFLRRAWELFVNGMAAAAAFLAGLLARETPEGGGGEADLVAGMSTMEVREPAQWLVILDQIFCALALLVALALLYLLLRKLTDILRRVLRRLWQQLVQFGSAASRDYEDEITDTRDGAQYERSTLGKRIREAFSRVDESKLSPTERVRWRYRRLRRRHTDWEPANTARETLPGEAAQLYERARYGAQTLTEAEAERFRSQTRKL